MYLDEIEKELKAQSGDGEGDEVDGRNEVDLTDSLGSMGLSVQQVNAEIEVLDDE